MQYGANASIPLVVFITYVLIDIVGTIWSTYQFSAHASSEVDMNGAISVGTVGDKET